MNDSINYLQTDLPASAAPITETKTPEVNVTAPDPIAALQDLGDIVKNLPKGFSIRDGKIFLSPRFKTKKHRGQQPGAFGGPSHLRAQNSGGMASKSTRA